MRKIIIVRHAHSTDQAPGQTDFDRPLSPRGKDDAKEMAEKILKNDIKIDAFISSPARRAKKTAKIFAKAYDVPKEEIILVDSLYNAPASAFFAALQDVDDKYESIAMFAHNPGITDFLNKVCPDADINNMPTAAVFSAQADVDSWKEFEGAEKKILFFKYPEKR